MRIAIAGGTGLIETMVVELAEAAGHQVVVLARGRGVDLERGDCVTAPLDGVAAVIDVTNVATLSAKRSTKFFATVTTNLLAAERAAGVRHHVALSIVGVDRAPYGYYAGKRAQRDGTLLPSADAVLGRRPSPLGRKPQTQLTHSSPRSRTCCARRA